LSNHVHGAFTVRSRSRFKNERITVLKVISSEYQIYQIKDLA